MSDEPKTLTPQAMTLKEAAERVAEKSDYLLARGEDGWGLIKRTVLGWDSEGLVWDDWEDAASFALGVPVVARDEAAELRAGFDKMVYRLDDALKEAAELRQAITEFITARREHFYYTVNESGLDVAEYNRTASRYEAALETLQRIGEP